MPVLSHVPAPVLSALAGAEAVTLSMWVNDRITAYNIGRASLSEWDGYGYCIIEVSLLVMAQNLRIGAAIEYTEKANIVSTVHMVNVDRYSLDIDGNFHNVRFYITDDIYYELTFRV